MISKLDQPRRNPAPDVLVRQSQKGENYCTFDEIQDRVWINFNLNPSEMEKGEKEELNDRTAVLRFRSGRDAVWYGIDLNQRIMEYLQKRLEQDVRTEEAPARAAQDTK